MGSEPVARFSKSRSRSGPSLCLKSSISCSPMDLSPPMANPTSKGSSILLTTNGSNSTRNLQSTRILVSVWLYIEDFMIKHGPFDGLLGFSQGAILSAALPGLQAAGVGLTKVPKINFLIIIGGAKLKDPSLAEKAYSCPIRCPSLHFLGETDFLKPYGIELLESVVDPVVIHHPKGHTIPRLDDKSLPIMLKFLERIQKIATGNVE
ncbi:hypothetical protein Vadar_016628 [Vaccinium darrowii]|uniref:Uncharacterized protein n=1 Tax=Vaccinium darrowii TaxID=229202 RepID=A0ACB7Y798_9ERIC|nr:hypothetical protein Vadar_016628 [Vaccinium darrowii]